MIVSREGVEALIGRVHAFYESPYDKTATPALVDAMYEAADRAVVSGDTLASTWLREFVACLVVGGVLSDEEIIEKLDLIGAEVE